MNLKMAINPQINLSFYVKLTADWRSFLIYLSLTALFDFSFLLFRIVYDSVSRDRIYSLSIKLSLP